MKTKIKYVVTALVASLGLNTASAAYQQPSTQNFMVLGNCGMCEKTIEKAALKKGVSSAEWNKDTKILTVQFNPKKVSADDILKGVAYAGYDNEKYLAPASAYENLHECCKYERVKLKHHAVSSQTNTSKEVTQEKQKKNELEQTYSMYFNLKDALVKTDNKESAAKAKDLVSAIESVNMNSLKEKEHDVFMKYRAGIKTDAGKIAESRDINKQRAFFSDLSDKMYELMKTIKPSYTVYLENCPMFNDGKGANWISKESTIKNPYYGSQMLTCGKVKETLK